MKRHLSLFLSIAVLGVLGRVAYLSSHHGTDPQYQAFAIAKQLRASFQPDANNAALLDSSWSQVDALLKQQGPKANVRATTAILAAFEHYRKANNAWDPQYQAVNPVVRNHASRIADAWLDVADAAMAGDPTLIAARQDKVTNLLIAMEAEVQKIDPRYLADRWRRR